MSEAKYGSIADGIAAQYGVPPAIMRSVIQTESGWRPYAVGKAGDLGIMQLTPVIYKSAQYKTQPFDPVSSMQTGARFLSDLFKQYGNWNDALSHYNAGFNLNNGRAYAAKVLNGAGLATPEDIARVTKNESFTPTLNKSVAGSNQGGDELKLAKPDTWLQEKMSEFFAWFGERFKAASVKIVIVLIIVISLWFAFKKLAGVR